VKLGKKRKFADYRFEKSMIPRREMALFLKNIKEGIIR
jgi:hypothetical protein